MLKLRRATRFKYVQTGSLLLLLGLAFFAACSDSAQKQNAANDNTVVIGMTGDFDSFNELNAASSEALQAIQYLLFMSLTTLDENLQFAPQLAESWEFAPGDTLLTFHLRRDVFWTDGVPTTAHDVVFTYQLAIDTTIAYPAASRFDQTSRVEARDDYTVRFHFKQAYADALFDTQIPILPKHILEKIPRAEIQTSAFNRKPIGNGPFQLVEWQANQRAVFAANARYALGRPKLERIVFQIIPEESVLLAQLLAGDIDFAPALEPASYQRIAAGDSSTSTMRAVRYPGRNYSFIAWNLARPRFTRRVRQALTLALDQQEIINTLLEGCAQPALGPLLPLAWAYDKTLRPHAVDLVRAKQLLAEEGWSELDREGFLMKNGRRLEFTIKTNADNQLRRDAAVMVQAQLQKIGVRVQVEALEWNLLLQQVFEQKDFDALLSAWDADFAVNPAPLWHSHAIEEGYNIVSYRNAKVDSLLDAARVLVDRRKAEPLWHEFQQIIIADCPYTFLFVPEKLAAFTPRLQNVKLDARSFLANVTQWQVARE